MSITELYLNFIAGRDLPGLGIRQSRALLDACRDQLLSLGRAISGKGDTKAQLIEARRLLVPGPEIYCAARPIETTLVNGIADTHLLDELDKLKKSDPNGSVLQHVVQVMSAAPITPPKVSAPITRPATTTPPKATTPKSVMPIAPKAKATTTRPTGKTPTPAHLIGSSVDHAGLAARAALQATARPAAVTPKAPPPRPLEDVPTATLVALATHRFSPPAERLAARAELSQRPEVTLFENGSYSVSTTRAAK